MQLGLISDTHGLLRPSALFALQGCARILHLGDVGSAEILRALEDLAPVVAVRGNHDHGPWADALPATRVEEVGGRRLLLVHDAKGLVLGADLGPIDAVISGHSHAPSVATRDGRLFVNPGSAGPRRFRLPVTVGLLTITADALTARIVDIAPG